MADAGPVDERLILGRPVASQIEQRAGTISVSLAEDGVRPTLAVVYRGDHDDARSYRKMIGQRAARTGVTIREIALDADAGEDKLVAEVTAANSDPAVHAILVQNPLPATMRHLVGRILSVEKDAEGLGAGNLGRLMLDEPCVTPCTPGAILALIESRVPSLIGKRVVIINRSATIGRPLSQMLLSRRATVTVCSTATVDLAGEARRAEILVVAIGKSQAIGAEFIGEGAVVIDVGINQNPSGDGIVGDVDTTAALSHAAAITPVPGGVGPVTTAVLIENVVKQARSLHAIHDRVR